MFPLFIVSVMDVFFYMLNTLSENVMYRTKYLTSAMSKIILLNGRSLYAEAQEEAGFCEETVGGEPVKAAVQRWGLIL